VNSGDGKETKILPSKKDMHCLAHSTVFTHRENFLVSKPGLK